MRILPEGFRSTFAGMEFDSLQTRMVIIRGMLLLLPSILIMLLQSYYIEKQMEQQAIVQLENGLAMQKAEIDRWFQEQQLFTEALARLPEVRAGNYQAAEVLLSTLAKGRKDINSLVLVDLQGNTVADSNDAPSVYIGDRRYFQEALAGQAVISEILVSRLDERPIIVFAQPVLDERQKLRGIMMSVVEITVLEKSMERFTYGETGITFLVDHEGKGIREMAHSTDLKLRPSNDLAEGSGEHYHYQDQFARSYLQLKHPLDYLGWYVVGQVEEAELHRGYRNHMLTVAVGMLLLLLILGPLSLMMVRRVVQPLLHLTERAQRVQAGEYALTFERRLFRDAPPEVQILCRAFEAMVVKLQENFQDQQVIQQALTEAEAMYRTLVESSLVGIYVLDRLRFSYLNPKGREILGLASKVEVEEKDLYDFVHPKDWYDTANSMRKSEKVGETSS